MGQIKLIHFFTSGITPWVFMKDHFATFSAIGWNSEIVAGDMSRASKFDDLNVQIRSAPYSRKLTLWNVVQSLLYTFKAIFRTNDGVIVAHTPMASAYVAIACFLLRKRFIFFCHGLVSKGANKGLSNTIFYFVERFVCRTAHSVFFVSPSLKDFALAEGYVNSHRSYSLTGSICGVKPCQRIQNEIGSSITLGYLGRVSREKGIFDCLAVLDTLRKNGTRCRLLVAGAIEDLKFLDATKSYPEVEYVGYINNKQEFFSKIDVLMCASGREGFGMSALEASSYGIPVVGYDIVGLKDAVSNGLTGILVGDVAELAAAVSQYVENPELYRKHSENAFVRAHSEFGYQKIIDEQVSLLDRLIGNIVVAR